MVDGQKASEAKEKGKGQLRRESSDYAAASQWSRLSKVLNF